MKRCRFLDQFTPRRSVPGSIMLSLQGNLISRIYFVLSRLFIVTLSRSCFNSKGLNSCTSKDEAKDVESLSLT